MTYEQARAVFVGLVKKRQRSADAETILRILDEMLDAELERRVVELLAGLAQ